MPPHDVDILSLPNYKSDEIEFIAEENIFGA